MPSAIRCLLLCLVVGCDCDPHPSDPPRFQYVEGVVKSADFLPASGDSRSPTVTVEFEDGRKVLFHLGQSRLEPPPIFAVGKRNVICYDRFRNVTSVEFDGGGP